MLNLSLAAVSRAEIVIRAAVPAGDPLFDGLGEDQVPESFDVDLIARSVGEGVLVRGRLEARLTLRCRRCVTDVEHTLSDSLDLLYDELDEEEQDALSGEVYPLPERGDDLDLRPALREQYLLRVPQHIECTPDCKGLCPRCGTDLNRADCDCVPEATPSPWDALKNVKFD